MVIDSSYFIEFYRAKDKTKTAFANLPSNSRLFVSLITRFELMAGAHTPQKWQEMEILLQRISLLNFTTSIADEAAKIFLSLRQKGQIIGTLDIFIAATALHHQLPVATLNKKDFSKVPGLT
ncbi:MAG: type II toxin-antitoxin system VapC family toxin, partial [Bacteroidota bacterium]